MHDRHQSQLFVTIHLFTVLSNLTEISLTSTHCYALLSILIGARVGRPADCSVWNGMFPCCKSGHTWFSVYLTEHWPSCLARMHTATAYIQMCASTDIQVHKILSSCHTPPIYCKWVLSCDFGHSKQVLTFALIITYWMFYSIIIFVVKLLFTEVLHFEHCKRCNKLASYLGLHPSFCHWQMLGWEGQKAWVRG